MFRRDDLWLVGPALIAAGLLAIALPRGIGLDPDSAVYLEGADNLAHHGRFSNSEGSPIVHFPPLWSAVLACAAALPGHTRDHAFFACLVLFAANVFFAGYIIHRWMASIGLAVSIQILMAASADFLSAHASVLSEPLFLLLTASGFLFLHHYSLERRPCYVVMAGLCLGLSALTRYAGVAWLTAGLTDVLCGREDKFKRRLSVAVLFAAVAGLPLILWIGRNHWIVGHAIDRQAEWSIFMLKREWPDLARAVRQWIFQEDPPDWSGWLGIGWAAGAVALLWRFLRAARRGLMTPGSLHVLRLAGLFSFFYLALLILTDLWFDSTPLDERILLPVHWFGLLSAAVVIGQTRPALEAYQKAALLVLGLLFIGYTAMSGYSWANDVRREGPPDLAAPSWQDEALFVRVCRLAPEIRLYSNNPALLYFNAARWGSMIPEKYDARTFLINRKFEEQWFSMLQDIRQGRAALVFFPAEVDPWLPPLAQINRNIRGVPCWTGRIGFLCSSTLSS